MSRPAFYSIAAILIAAASHLSAQEAAVPANDTARSVEASQSADLDLTLSPFYSDVTLGEAGISEYPDSRWYLRGGADSRFDIDPRDTMVLPRPEPALVFDLR